MSRRPARKEEGEPGPPWWLRAVAYAPLLSLILLFATVLALAVPVLIESSYAGESSVFSWDWNPGQKRFGILPMIAGSLILSVSAAACAWPLALGLCALTVTGPGWIFAALLRPAIRFMTAVPTVVYGFAAIFLLLPLTRAILGRGSGLGLASAGLLLVILILPTMVLIMEAGLRDGYEQVRLNSAALGFSPLETLCRWVLPQSASVLTTAMLLGFGRALGDTMISLMLAGNAPQTPLALSDSFRTLSAHIALVTANEAGGAAYNSLFAAGAILLAISCGVNLTVRALRQERVKSPSGFLSFGRLAGFIGSVETKLLAILGTVGGLICLAALSAIIALLLHRAWGVLDLRLFFGDVSPLAAITNQRPVWDGLWPACLGSLSLVTLTMLLALPPGLACGIFLAEYAGPRPQKYLGALIDMAAGTPSIVMGLFGFTLIVLMRRLLPEANTCLFLSAACMSLLVLPVLVSATREAVLAVPGNLRHSMAALGFSKGQTIRLAVLPSASRGILGGIIISMGRAAEDAAVIMLTGAVANAGFFKGLWSKFQALPFSIYYTAAQYQNQAELNRGFGAALVLLTMCALLFMMARLIERGYSRSMKG